MPGLRPRSAPRALAGALLLAALLLAPVAAWAQDPGTTSRPPAEWNGSLRLGLFDMVNSADSYDAVYDELMPQFGGGLERQRGHWRFSGSLDYGTVTGERVILAGGGNVIGTGIDEDLTLIPIHLTAAWRFNPRNTWEWSAGAGPSFLSWDVDGINGGESGSEVGGSVMLGLRRQGAAWDFGGELRYSTFAGAFDDLGGITDFYDEDDAGGITLTLLAARGF